MDPVQTFRRVVNDTSLLFSSLSAEILDELFFYARPRHNITQKGTNVYCVVQDGTYRIHQNHLPLPQLNREFSFVGNVFTRRRESIELDIADLLVTSLHYGTHLGRYEVVGWFGTETMRLMQIQIAVERVEYRPPHVEGVRGPVGRIGPPHLMPLFPQGFTVASREETAVNHRRCEMHVEVEVDVPRRKEEDLILPLTFRFWDHNQVTVECVDLLCHDDGRPTTTRAHSIQGKPLSTWHKYDTCVHPLHVTQVPANGYLAVKFVPNCPGTVSFRMAENNTQTTMVANTLVYKLT